jgi:hypothetical protein
MTRPKQKKIKNEKTHRQESFSHRQRRDLDNELKMAVRYNDLQRLDEKVFHILGQEKKDD